MASDPGVIQAIADAVERDPGNNGLRLHLARLLLDAGRPAEALIQSQQVMSSEPANLEALELGAKAARDSGNLALAEGYAKLASALGYSAAHQLLGGAPQAEDQPAEWPFDDDDVADLFSSDPDIDDLEEDTDDSDTDMPIKLRQGEELPFEPIYELSSTTLKDVAGMEAVKRRLELAFLGPMKNPELRAMYKKSLRGGLLLYGPPGCGKTHIARAVAGELQARFMSIGLTDVVDMYIGQSEKNLHEIFQAARRLAPVVIFIDEIDALGRKRSLQRDSGGRTLINQLLQELDGLDSANEGIYVLAATNHPWDIDAALRRPGRLDRTVLVVPPDIAARENIIRMNLVDRPHERVDIARLAKETDDFSGADLVHLVDSAAELAMEEAIKTGKVRAIQHDDFRRALKEMRPSTKSWMETAKKHVVYANVDGLYDDLKDYLKSRRIL
jgi:SpoVK/Ycf46/Vps4 family AAA+-type ATPase